MPGAVQGMATQVDQLHQGISETVVRSLQEWTSLLLQVGSIIDWHGMTGVTFWTNLFIVKWYLIVRYTRNLTAVAEYFNT